MSLHTIRNTSLQTNFNQLHTPDVLSVLCKTRSESEMEGRSNMQPCSYAHCPPIGYGTCASTRGQAVSADKLCAAHSSQRISCLQYSGLPGCRLTGDSGTRLSFDTEVPQHLVLLGVRGAGRQSSASSRYLSIHNALNR